MEEAGDRSIPQDLLSLQQKVQDMKMNAGRDAEGQHADAESDKAGRRRKKKGKNQSGAKAGLDVGAAEFVPVMAGVFNAESDSHSSNQGEQVKAFFPCYYIEYDAEPEPEEDKDLAKYKELAEQVVAELNETSGGGSAALWSGEEHESTKGDKQFRKFRKRVARAPEQVLRYCWNGEPLWQSSEAQCTEVPPCPRCGSSRVYEMQAMPGLFYELGVEAFAPKGDEGMDCGVAIIYSCSSSCGSSGQADGDGSGEDFVFIQRDTLVG
ncbi:hypothetical protein GUITHDRAFT_153364 [Guillardia theta CCMP2712]|uniref:Programmed cell death protein 2 C-terminal domain-containing protein n=1 Tax=Guillardia theta (strain CCMP2712) TaxID=905079 RepID=L1J492_GUITC|nr:hypothetical protein GUITHDRAFT_153364 [Guillardia theta CCMP2712]EKX43152.1 hypothetical protein GUITHDRAFT_153364 [Guillardia theta CCMP2712]|eukprot:XP_005830132.1 hypothetical protein GUITHDRAFT_153364 [Guillardia theta CCMP2712]